MVISRRGFLGAAAGLATCTPRLMGGGRELTSDSPWAAPQRTRSAAESVECVLVDSGGPLRESIAGYQVALAEARKPVTTTRPGTEDLHPAPNAIVPGCVNLEPATASWLQELLEAGGLVLIESGAPFAALAEYERHQELLASRFGIEVRSPVNLWEPAGERAPRRLSPRARVPYIDYVWPGPTKVRDFSRVAPVRPADKVVAWAGEIPVAVRTEVRRGTVIFLGSPLGPALLSGDREARAWLCMALGMSERTRHRQTRGRTSG